MTTDDKIRDQKLQYDIKKEAAKKKKKKKKKPKKKFYQVKLINMNILWVKRNCFLIKAKIEYFPLGKACEKQTE